MKQNKPTTVKRKPMTNIQYIFTVLAVLVFTVISGCDTSNPGSRVKVPVPATPANLATQALPDSIDINWSAVEHAENYKLYRCPINSAPTIAADVCNTQTLQACDSPLQETPSNSYTDTSALATDAYCYIVQACNSENACSSVSTAAIGHVERNLLTVTASGPQFAKVSHTVSLSANVQGAEDDISYAWSQTSGITITLTGEHTIAPSFTAPLVSSPEKLTFEVEVSRGGEFATNTVIVTVQPDNILVNAGADKVVANGDTVSLHARGIGDGVGSDYTWQQTKGTNVTLSNGNTANPSFTAPSPVSREDLEFEVSFTDGLKTGSDKVIITIAPPPNLLPHSPLTVPVASHGVPLMVSVLGSSHAFAGGEFTIAASATGGDQHYSWLWEFTQKSSPSAPDPVMSNTDHAILTVDLSSVSVPVQYSFKVTVTDNEGTSHTETSQLIVNTGSTITFTPLVVDAPSIIVNENFPGALSALASGGTPPYQYKWQQFGVGPQVTLTGADTDQAIFTGPNVDADTTLSFEVEVTDENGAGVSFTKNLNAKIHDVFSYAPQQVLRLQPMPIISVLSGQSSRLTVGVTGGDSQYTWQWSQVSGTNVAAFSGEDTAVLAVTMPTISVTETLTFKVIVTDGLGSTAEETVNVEVTSTPRNAALQLVPIPGLHINEGESAHVVAQATGGSGQYSYQWSAISGIDGQALSNTNQNVVTLDAPAVTAKQLVTLQAIATDTVSGLSITENVLATINDISATLQLLSLHDIKVSSGNFVTLHGGDAGGGKKPYTYTWLQTGGTPSVTLNNASSSNANFTAPTVTAKTTFTFEMTVTDDIGNTATVTEHVTVAPPIPPLTATLNGANSGQSGTKMSLNALAGGGVSPYTYSYTTRGVQINIDATDNPTFTVPAVTQDTIATVTLIVHDSSTPKQQQTSAEHKITIKPAAPASNPDNPENIAPVTAEICSGPLCGIIPEPPTQCPPEKPYAMNSLDFNTAGGADLTKSCANFHTCNNDWWQSSSDVALCTSLIGLSDPDASINNVLEQTRNCSYCCQTPGCNTDTVPARRTLFHGSD